MRSLARRGRARLEAAGVPSPAQDAELLLAHALGVDRARLHLRPDDPVSGDAARRYEALLARRAAREPLQHLTGVQEFWSLRLRVTPEVLIPRPESEGIVEAFLAGVRAPDPLVLDLGTGSGCLAIAVARERPAARLHATDLSAAALEVARKNAADHGVEGRIMFHAGDLFEPIRQAALERSFDAILSNPPYVGAAELERLEPEVRDHEPRLALTPGEDGLLVHRRLAREAAAFLKPGGLLIAEFGAGQENPLRALYDSGLRAGSSSAGAAAGSSPGSAPALSIVEIRPDLAGIPRILVARAR